jgi:hypothetical protein
VPVGEQRDRHQLARKRQLVPGTVAPTVLAVAVVVTPTAQACVEQWEEGTSLSV